MKIVSWNVNSIKARLEHVKNYLQSASPDYLLLQELKGVEFPESEFSDLGYSSNFVSQKAYNGVAILSKKPQEQEVILKALPQQSQSEQSDEQARYLEIECSLPKNAQDRYGSKSFHLINIYLPNGNPVDTEKYPYKLSWMERLYSRLHFLRNAHIPFVIGGDFNVIPEPKDCYDPKAWEGDALYRLSTKQAYRKILNLGLYDAFRIFHSEAEQYTFWDYQRGAWEKNNGIRIDHFLLSPEIADICNDCHIDSTPRGWAKASDHTPIMVELAS